jgi:hypothetical protein
VYPVGPVTIDGLPVGPVDPVPNGPVYPVGPVTIDGLPVGPVDPVPNGPVGPVTIDGLPVGPVDPVPNGPVGPVTIDGLPVGPVDPVTPVGPAIPIPAPLVDITISLFLKVKLVEFEDLYFAVNVLDPLVNPVSVNVLEKEPLSPLIDKCPAEIALVSLAAKVVAPLTAKDINPISEVFVLSFILHDIEIIIEVPVVNVKVGPIVAKSVYVTDAVACAVETVFPT